MEDMTDAPDRRDGFDTGSVSELAADCREVPLPRFQPRTGESTHVEIEVPARAAALVDGLGDYGS